MKKIIFFLAAIALVSSAYSQQYQLGGQRIPGYRSTALQGQFAEYAVFQLDADALLNVASQAPGAFNMQIKLEGFPAIETALKPNQVISDRYFTSVQTGLAKTRVAEQPAVFTYLGFADGQKADQVAITVAQDFIYGFFEKNGQRFFIEPLRYFVRGEAADRFVVYNGDDVRYSEGLVCSPIEIKNKMEDVPEDTQPTGPPNCKPLELEIAIANDYQMVQKYGTASAAFIHNIGVMNNAQANWDDEFARVILFKIVTQYAPTSAENDPFPATNSVETLIAFFRDWANAGGFGAGVIYDLGHWRSPRKMTNSLNQHVAGAAYTNQVCTDHRYGVFSETSINNQPYSACQLRTTVSHEMGHSFNASHTPQSGNDIMRPVLACSEIWHANSIAQINARIATATCLSPSNCTAQPPALPESMAYICTPDEECFTFTAPCVGGYFVGTNDPNLQVTTSGTTICLKSLVEGYRQSRVYISAYNHCGVQDPFGISVVWNVVIDHETHCPGLQGSEPRNQASTSLSGDITLRNLNSYLSIEDQAQVTRSKDIQIFDMSGKLVLHQVDAAAQIQLPLANLPQGLFVVRIGAGKDILVTKISHW
ncbi:MAG: M12 family metallo-peptidase [Saprospiraceae bacterium]